MNRSSVPDFYTGPPVDSDELQFREEFLSELWETLEAQHVLLAAPRRTGKTRIMDHLARHPQDHYKVVAINVQDLDHPADVFQALLDALHDHHPNFVVEKLADGWSLISNTLKRVGEVGVAGFKLALRESDKDWRSNWRSHGEKFLRQIRQHGEPVLLIIDELPDMLLNLQKEDSKLLGDFLGWWRSQRLPPDAPHPKEDSVRWLVGGSVNLKATLDSLGLVDRINDMKDVELPVLTRQQVGQFVMDMLAGRGVQFDKAIVGRVLDRLGRPIPLFLQMATQDLYRLWKKRPTKKGKRQPLTPEDVDQVFDDLIRSSAAQDKLQHFYSRIQRYYSPPLDDTAYELLSQLSISSNGLSRRALQQEFDRVLNEAGVETNRNKRKSQFNQMMRDLENDFYVVETAEDQYDFASGVMKAWWRKYYA